MNDGQLAFDLEKKATPSETPSSESLMNPLLHQHEKLLSFDIEISDVFELQPGEDLEVYAPFHISIAATAILGGEEKLWYSQNASGVPELNLSEEGTRALLAYLAERQNDGFKICAWNGLHFDLKWIGHCANDRETAARIALKSYDPMFQFFNQKGFPVGLARVAAGMAIGQEKLMDGADAPVQWRAGNHQQVMDYVMGDCQMTNLIVRSILDAGEIRWKTSKGTIRSEPMPTLKTVKDVIADPEPDQSWMDRPLLKESFYDWIPEMLL